MNESKPHSELVERAREIAATTAETELWCHSAQTVIYDLVEQLEALDAWASRMPDAGFTSDDPRWDWWHERPRLAIPAKRLS